MVDTYVQKTVAAIIKPKMTGVEKVKAINDHVVLNTVYSEESKHTPHAAYTIITEGKGVCQAYAALTYKLLKAAGISNYYVTGFTDEEHAWNLVKVDGKWYHLDTTWNDPVFNKSAQDMSDYIRYQYFLISDAQIKQDHRMDYPKKFPAATSERFVEMRSIEMPVMVGSVLYYANERDDTLYRLHLNASTPTARKISDMRVGFLTYANNALYFSNYSNGGYLYKRDLATGQEIELARNRISAITISKGELLAYSGNQIVYRESVQKN